MNFPFLFLRIFTLTRTRRRFAFGLVFALLGGALLDFAAAAPPNVLRLATTTSTENSGLLDYLLPRFERAHGVQVQVIAVGTGKALRLGETGDVDAVLVHAPASEKRFVARGFGVEYKQIMANDFVIVGNPRDPAEIQKAHSATDALRRIAAQRSIFVSRGDDSGTHKKELNLWQRAGIAPRGGWYWEVGQGMAKSLQIAAERQAYLLIDRATWTYLAPTSDLALLYAGDPILHNPYGVMAVNPARHDTNFAAARAFINYLASPDGQAAIGAYAVRGTRLFTPTYRPAQP